MTDVNQKQNVLIPIKLDAFVLDDVCEGGPGKAKIAPISQPNYTFLRLDEEYLQSDILYSIDIHNVAGQSGANFNSRITDLGSGERREKRLGVYLHWTIPRIYRSGTTSTNTKNKENGGLPDFPEAPTRWLVIRHIHDLSSVQPEAARTGLKPVMAWVVESDRCRTIDGPRSHDDQLINPIDVLDEKADLQVDVSPFVSTAESTGKGSVLDKQAEVFIGDKVDVLVWKETAPSAGGPDTTKSRINLQLMSSSNELFPDFQPHCSNVFSIVDNFCYGKDSKENEIYATSVSCSYSVIGWNSKDPSDIMALSETETGWRTREERFAELNVKIKGFQKMAEPMVEYPQEIYDWFSFSTGTEQVPTRSICHGAMYDVQWNINKAPANVQADSYAELLHGKQPIAIGTTPMDALMAYAGAHERIDGGTIKGEIEAGLRRLEAILLSRDDGVESHSRASDLMYNWNYLRLDGGDHYHAAASGDKTGNEKPSLPKEKQVELLELNRFCRLRDAASRTLRRQRWIAFSRWWFAVTGAQKHGPISSEMEHLREVITALEKTVSDCQVQINKRTGVKPGEEVPDPNEVKEFEPGVHPPFEQQRDPTLLIGGVHSGWEVDFLLTLIVRLDCQVMKAEHDDNSDWSTFFASVVDAKDKLPEWMRGSTKKLLREFVALRLKRTDADDGHPDKPSILSDRGLIAGSHLPFREVHELVTRPELKHEIPLFHDQLGRDINDIKVWRDYWNGRQPWFPLFLEWEVEYTHIKHDDWELSDSKWWHGEGVKTHYGIRNNVDLAQDYYVPVDRQSFSGRVLILPQPSFSLETKITQLMLDTLPSELNEYLPQAKRDELVKNLHALQLLSAPLGGFNNHLQTVEQGNHVKPSIRDPIKGELNFLTEALRAKAGFDENQIRVMGIETDVTPYGAARKSIAGENGPSSFKPVVHGQFKLTKVNVIDKFGQVIHALDPSPVPENMPPEEISRTWPCLSDWYSPGVKVTEQGNTVPNTVENSLDEKDPNCEFAQVPPQINQSARINACWVMPAEPEARTPKNPFWRATHDWDSPIWGWVVINYANYGLQFFLPSGAFYREVRCGGPNGALASPEWLPFKNPDTPDHFRPKPGKPEEANGTSAQQLVRLVQTISTTKEYLKQFMAMLTAATVNAGDAAPSAYAEFKSALVGKPLALVNMGWSLELATPAQKSSLIGDGIIAKTLYKAPVTRAYPGPGCDFDYDPSYEYDTKHYRFPMKLGDRERGFDGLVGYFKPWSDPKPGDALDLSAIYTHHAQSTPAFDAEFRKLSDIFKSPNDTNVTREGPIVKISPENYPRLPPYYIDPISSTDQDYDDITNEQLCVFGAIVDPFSPVHGFSGILPIKELVLPNWMWQTAMDKLSPFFHIGPVLVTTDVPDFDATRELTQGNLVPKDIRKRPNEAGVTLPGGGALGQWTWLQPYLEIPREVGGEVSGSITFGSGGGGFPMEKYMALAVDPVDELARLERGPYTALEGYLQMASGAVDEKDVSGTP